MFTYPSYVSAQPALLFFSRQSSVAFSRCLGTFLTSGVGFLGLPHQDTVHGLILSLARVA